MEVLRSALRHGIAPEDIHHAVNHAITIDEAGDDPVRWLMLGPAVIHAMPMRAQYQRLLQKGRREQT